MGGSCQKHGPQDNWAGVCRNLGDAFIDRQPVGFYWGVDNDFCWAVCDECRKQIMDGVNRSHDLVPLCRQCFAEARLLNGNPEAVQ